MSNKYSSCCTSADCDYASVERINRQELLPVLEELVRTAFFRYFKVNLYCDCPFWPDDSMCSSRDCSVCECEPHEVPPSWLAADQQACEGPNSFVLYLSDH